MFFDNNWNDESLLYTPSKKYLTSSNKELTDIIATINKLEPTSKSTTDNISNEEKCALREIQELTKSTIEIKKADKTSTLVIMDKDEYKEQLVMKCHLNTP